MINDWVVDCESKVFTIAKALMEDDLRTLFPRIRFTTSDESSTEPVFPTVYMHQIPSAETDADMNSSDVNAIIVNMRVAITVNTTKKDLKKIMLYVMDAFKKMHFRVTSSFDVDTKANMYSAIIEFRRSLGSEDELI